MKKNTRKNVHGRKDQVRDRELNRQEDQNASQIDHEEKKENIQQIEENPQIVEDKKEEIIVSQRIKFVTDIKRENIKV